MLALPAERITLGSVVRSMDGPLAPISCVSISGYLECGCPEPSVCGLRSVWKEARDALATILDNTTFAQIVDRQHSCSSGQDRVIDYII